MRIQIKSATEGTKYDNIAVKLIVDSGLFDESTARNIINALMKGPNGNDPDIHAFVRAKPWLEKYIIGIARMMIEEASGSSDRAADFLRSSPQVFEQYLQWIKKNRTEENKTKLDDGFRNRMSYKEVQDFIADIRKKENEQSKQELEKMEFTNSDYELIPIESYQQMNELFGGNLTGDGKDLDSAWCHTNIKSVYNSWLSEGIYRFFVLAKKGWKNIKPIQGKNCPYDEYGLSLMAIRVGTQANLVNVTSRWNHKYPSGAASSADNIYTKYSELSKVVGFNVEQRIPKLKALEPKFHIENGVLEAADLNGNSDITIPDSVTSIGGSAFSGCSGLTSVTIPDSVTSIGDGAFHWCTSLTSITIPDSVTSIGRSTFYDCSSLTSINIPNSVTSIGRSTFYDCSSLTSITIPNSVTSIGDSTFDNCSSLTSIVIPNSVTSIGYAAFSNCKSLTSITIPDSVTIIGSHAFSFCKSLTSITIPNSVTHIGSYAFTGCSSLTMITDNPHAIDYARRYGLGVISPTESAREQLNKRQKRTMISPQITRKMPIVGADGITGNGVISSGRAGLESYEMSGDCFQQAWKAFYNSLDRDPLLVHGVITGQGAIEGIQYVHAWIEIGDMVVDTTISLFKNGFPRDAYYGLARADESRIFKYDRFQVSDKAMEYQTYGPWEPELEQVFIDLEDK